MGRLLEDMGRMKAEGQSKMMKSYGIIALGSLVIAFVLSPAIAFAGSYQQLSGFPLGLEVGFTNWIGFIAPVTLGGVLWEGKSWKFWVLNADYYFVLLLAMGVILAVWV